MGINVEKTDIAIAIYSSPIGEYVIPKPYMSRLIYKFSEIAINTIASVQTVNTKVLIEDFFSL
jgi:hypothetical protein